MEIGSEVSFEKDEIIFREKEFSRDLYILKTGKVCLFRSENGVDVLLGEVAPGGIFGEIALIDGGARTAHAIACESCTAKKVSPSEFFSKLDTLPEWFIKVARILAQRLRETNEKIDAATPQTKEAGVANILGFLSHSESGPERVNLKTAEEEITDILGIQFSEVDSLLNALKEKGLIEIGSSYVLCKDTEKIEKHAADLIEKTRISTRV
ncbi:MAG: Crp/Fnr family transcriptional regulator [Fibrobacterota bacterium]